MFGWTEVYGGFGDGSGEEMSCSVTGTGFGGECGGGVAGCGVSVAFVEWE